MGDFILQYMKEKKLAFSLDSLALRLGMKKSLIHGCLVELEARGLITSFHFQKCKYYIAKEI